MSQNLFAGRVEPIQLEDEMQRSYLDYAMSVIVSRALPDVRDGLKPVQRRILWSMIESGLRPDRPHRKSVAAVGEVLKKYHPHCDQSVYDALVRMAQDWSLRYPLVDGHGNFGSVDGDPAAAYRYTEARLAPMAMELLRDLNERDGTTILAVLHDLGLAAHFFPRLVLLDAGRVVADGPPGHVLSPERIRDVFGVDPALVRLPA